MKKWLKPTCLLRKLTLQKRGKIKFWKDRGEGLLWIRSKSKDSKDPSQRTDCKGRRVQRRLNLSNMQRESITSNCSKDSRLSSKKVTARSSNNTRCSIKATNIKQPKPPTRPITKTPTFSTTSTNTPTSTKPTTTYPTTLSYKTNINNT